MKTKSNTINLLRPSVTLGDYSQHEASGAGGSLPPPLFPGANIFLKFSFTYKWVNDTCLPVALYIGI